MKTATTRTLLLCVSLTVVVGGMIPSARADRIEFAGTVDSTFNIGGELGRTEVATKYLNGYLDPAGPSSFYSEFSYTLHEPVTKTWTESRLLPGTFTSVDFTRTLTIDPFTTIVSDVGRPIPLVNNSTTIFGEAEQSYKLDPTAVTGSFSISGPTETQSGAFSHTFAGGWVTPQFYDVSGLPDVLRVGHESIVRGGPSVLEGPFTYFDGTVDGIPWNLQIDDLGFDAVADGVDEFKTIPIVPEPAALATAFVGVLLIHFVGRKRKPEASVGASRERG